MRVGEQAGGLPLTCGKCGSFDLRIVGGEELYVESLELEEQPEKDQKLAAGS